MSNNRFLTPRDNTSTIVLSSTVIIGLTIAAIVALSFTDQSGTVIATLIGFTANSLGIIALLARQDKAKEAATTAAVVAQDTNEKVDHVLNGEMEAKVEAVMHKVLAKRDREWQQDNGSVTKPETH